MARFPSSSSVREDRAVTAVRSLDERRARRRSLGHCAHCGQPVSLRDDFVRLYRRVWHTDCALTSDGIETEAVSPPARPSAVRLGPTAPPA